MTTSPHGPLRVGIGGPVGSGNTALMEQLSRRLSRDYFVAATTNDVRGQMAALRDLGALPRDTDLDAVIVDLGLDRPPLDPTTLTGEEMVHEVLSGMPGGAWARLGG